MSRISTKSSFPSLRFGILSLLLVLLLEPRISEAQSVVSAETSIKSSLSSLRGALGYLQSPAGPAARQLEDDNEDDPETLDEEEEELEDELEDLEEEEFDIEEEEVEAEEELVTLYKDDELLGDAVDPENVEEEEELQDELEELDMELDEVHDEEDVVVDEIDDVETEKLEDGEQDVPDPIAEQEETDAPETTKTPTSPPTEAEDEPAEYTPKARDPIQVQDEEIVEQVEEELAKEQKVAREAGGFGFFLAIGAMIFTAHQMSENPDGLYARYGQPMVEVVSFFVPDVQISPFLFSLCRLAITIAGVVVKIICMPCRKLMGAGGNSQYTGHMPISTVDYGFKGDSGFEMR